MNQRHMIPFVKPVYPQPRSLFAAFKEHLESGNYNDAVESTLEFEKKFARHVGSKYCVSVCNGTLGLVIAIRALQVGGNVIVPSFTFSASAHALAWNGIRPNFVDIDPETLNQTPETVEKAISAGTTAILATHTFGNPCDIEGLHAVAKRHRLKLLFDSANALGSRYRGALIGRFGDAEVFSFHATKILPLIEGGAIVTNDRTLFGRMKLLRAQGNRGDGNCVLIGLNARMHPISALMGLQGLNRLDDNLERRSRSAQHYVRLLEQIPGLSFQKRDPWGVPNHQYLPIIVNRAEFGCSRDVLHAILQKDDIDTRKYFCPPIHKFRCYRHLCRRGDGRLHTTERISKAVLCLPLDEEISMSMIGKICRAIAAVPAKRRARA